jgi:hypothetical protein
MAEERAARGAIDWRAAVWAGIAAGVIATGAELLLWRLFARPLPEILYRDARLAAAIVLGRGVLPPPASFDAAVMAAATVVHFVLSVAYTALLAPLVTRLGQAAAVAVGTGFGLLLFAVNMYGFTWLFPWFSAVRDGITLATHGVFGAAAALGYRALSRRRRAGYDNR